MRVLESPEPSKYAWVEEVFHDYYEDLCHFVRSLVSVDDLAEDLVQDLFVSICVNPVRWLEAGDALRPLLFVAARNRALDHLRKQRVRERHAERMATISPPDPAPPADLPLLQELLQQELELAIADLPDRAREIFLLSREEGLTYHEIADRLGITVKTVENQISRSLARLRSRVAGYLVLLTPGATLLFRSEPQASGGGRGGVSHTRAMHPQPHLVSPRN